MPKTFFTYEQQLNKLQNEKQLTITNLAYAEEVLEKLSYYSLIGGYKNLFKHPASGNYIYGVTFEEIVAFYYFDEELRTLFLKYILHVERHMKSMISYYFCEKYGENQSAYLDEHNYNLSKKNDQVAIFEYGHIYEPKRFPLDELPKEYSLISGLMCGGPAENGYPNDQREYDFFDIKAVMENVLSALSIRDYKIRRTNYPVFHPGVSAEFVKNDVILARFGELHPAVLDKWNIKRIVYGFTISLPDIMIFAGAATNYKKIPKFPSAERDLAVLVPEQLSNENIENIIRQAGNKHLEKLYLFDLYQGKQVPAGFKSMAYRLSFRASDRTLTDAEVDNWIETIVISLGKVNVVLRT